MQLGWFDKVLGEVDAFKMGVLQLESTRAGALFLLLVLCVGGELGGGDGGIEHVGGGETFAFQFLGQIDEVGHLELVPELFKLCFSPKQKSS